MIDNIKKNKIIILAIVSFVAIFILTAGIENIQFIEGEPFNIKIVFSKIFVYNDRDTLSQADLYPLKIIIPVIIIILILVFIFFPSTRSMFFRTFITILIFLYILRFRQHALLNGFKVNSFIRLFNSGFEQSGNTLLAKEIQPPLSMVTFTISLTIVALIIWIVYLVWKKRNLLAKNSFDDLKTTARYTLEKIRKGGDFKNAIIECYYKMEEYLYLKREIERSDFMTPREFEIRLQKLDGTGDDLPIESITELIRIFEKIRYSAAEVDDIIKKQSIHYLDVIVKELK